MDVEVRPDTVTDREDKGKLNRYVLSGDLIAGRITITKELDDSETVDKSWYHLDHTSARMAQVCEGHGWPYSQMNSTKCVTDEAGLVEVSYVYRAFGEQLKKLGEGEATYTYGGKELDVDTNLYYFNARYYDATIGRFINVDPIQDGSNWYVYCHNNPMSFVDPTGLSDDNIEERLDRLKSNTKISGVIKNPNKINDFVITNIKKAREVYNMFRKSENTALGKAIFQAVVGEALGRIPVAGGFLSRAYTVSTLPWTGSGIDYDFLARNAAISEFLGVYQNDNTATIDYTIHMTTAIEYDTHGEYNVNINYYLKMTATPDSGSDFER